MHKWQPQMEVDDPETYARHEWALALLDMRTDDPGQLSRLLETLRYVCPMLKNEECALAKEAVIMRMSSNHYHDLVDDFIETLATLKSLEG